MCSASELWAATYLCDPHLENLPCCVFRLWKTGSANIEVFSATGKFQEFRDLILILNSMVLSVEGQAVLQVSPNIALIWDCLSLAPRQHCGRLRWGEAKVVICPRAWCCYWLVAGGSCAGLKHSFVISFSVSASGSHGIPCKICPAMSLHI